MPRTNTTRLLLVSLVAFGTHMVLGGFYIGFPTFLDERIAVVVLILAILSLLIAVVFLICYLLALRRPS